LQLRETEASFWATVYKTVRDCDVGALWPNGWTDQDTTWQAGRNRPWPHCVRWGPSSPSPKEHSPTRFSAHILCGQMAAWIKMPLGMELGFSPGDFVLDRDPALPSPKQGLSPRPNFRSISIVVKRLQYRCMHQDATWYGGRPHPRGLCVRWNPAPPLNFQPMFISYCDFVRTLHNAQPLGLLVYSSSSFSRPILCILVLEKKV